MQRKARKIKNWRSLAVSPLRRKALAIAEAGLWAIDTEQVLRRSLAVTPEGHLLVKGERFHLPRHGKLLVAAIGKCAFAAARALEAILGDRIDGGIAVGVGEPHGLSRIYPYQGTHPFPSEKNVAASRELIAFLQSATKDDVVLTLISGGGSTLLCLPPQGTCMGEEQLIKKLFHAGATIQDINTIRKHLSFARGGFLAKEAYPAQVVSLIFSDVPGDDIAFISSGPTVYDHTTVRDARRVLEKFHLAREVPEGALLETPKEKRYFSRVRNILLVSSHTALAAMREEARQLGFRTRVDALYLRGEAAELGAHIITELHKAPRKSAYLYGGETTVTVRGHGHGGRNLELALSATRFVREGEILVAIASDGRDNSRFGGAICDTIAKDHLIEKGIDIEQFLANNDECPVYEAIGDYLMMGNTGSNVSDLMVVIKE
ncbi:DUF4147 domain-containing protein [Candidatus Parcubacteria bacterium]|nr:MAG: DUF4147 domain-containing protein [Candidatus Parcubacteria bacterium]